MVGAVGIEPTTSLWRQLSRWAEDFFEPSIIHHDASIAIINGTESFVIGGHSRPLDACCEEAIASGATRAVRIRVSVPSHTKMLTDAVAPFNAVLREAAPRKPEATYRLLSGIDGDTVQNIESACDKLSRQICTTVDWAACLESCREADARLVLELGPGAALSHMAAPLFPDGRVRSADEFHTMSGLRTWLSKALDWCADDLRTSTAAQGESDDHKFACANDRIAMILNSVGSVASEAESATRLTFVTCSAAELWTAGGHGNVAQFSTGGHTVNANRPQSTYLNTILGMTAGKVLRSGDAGGVGPQPTPLSLGSSLSARIDKDESGHAHAMRSPWVVDCHRAVVIGGKNARDIKVQNLSGRKHDCARPGW
jgi:hypothetical protein